MEISYVNHRAVVVASTAVHALTDDAHCLASHIDLLTLALGLIEISDTVTAVSQSSDVSREGKAIAVYLCV